MHFDYHFRSKAVKEGSPPPPKRLKRVEKTQHSNSSLPLDASSIALANCVKDSSNIAPTTATTAYSEASETLVDQPPRTRAPATAVA